VEVLLYRWSTLAQIVSLLTIAVFFVVLGRSRIGVSGDAP
jgi:hypothetical protein